MSSNGSPEPPAEIPPLESRAGDVVIILTVMQAFSTIVLIMRLWTRLFVQGMRPGADDWTIIASWIFLVAYTVDVCTQTRFGLGQHGFHLPPDTNIAASLQLFYFGEALYYITVSLTKVSILFLYLKLFPQHNYRIFLWSFMVFVSLTGIACTIAGIFQCNPIHKAWHPGIPGTCFNQVALFLANAGLNIFQDLVIYVLPVPMLWKVQLPLKQRLALIVVFVVGGFVCVTGMIRLESLTLAASSDDPTWDNYGAAIWSSIEANFGIVCASLVHFKPLIARYAPSWLGIYGSSSKGGSNNMMRLGDEPSGGKGSLPTFGGSGRQNSKKPFGILTEMELEENPSQSQSDLINSRRTGVTATTVTHMPGSSDEESQLPRGGIHTTKHFSISYKDAS